MCSVSRNENGDSFHAEDLPSDAISAERKRKAEHVNADKIAKIKMSLNSDHELPSDNDMSTIAPNLEHLAEVWLSTVFSVVNE